MLKIENAEGTVLAFLNNLTEAKVHEVLNGEYTISFIATIDHLKTDFLYDDSNLINYNDDLFRPVTIEELHDEDGALTVAVECEHVSYDLINNVLDNFNYTNTNVASVMAQCLLGTNFSLRSCDITEKTSIQYTEECNSKQISIAIANNWHGELKYYRYYIDLVKSRGTNRGTGFIFGKNLKFVKRIINRAEGTTSYEVEIIEGSETDELGKYYLGDTVRIMDKRLNVDYYCRIIEIEKDILTGLNSKVVLGDAIKDMRSTFSGVKKDVEEVKATISENSANWNKVSEIVNESGDIVLGKLNALTNIATKIVNSTGTFEQLDNCLYWHDQPLEVDSTFATKWGSQGLVFANSKDTDGNWEWQAALSSDGLIATNVTASCLEAIQAHVLSLVVDNLVGKVIQGVTIIGSTILAGNENNGTTFTMIDTHGDIIRFANGKKVLELSGSTGDGGGTILLTAYDGSGTLLIDTNIVSGSDRCARIDANGIALSIINSGTGANITIGNGISIDPGSNDVSIEGNVYVSGELHASGGVV